MEFFLSKQSPDFTSGPGVIVGCDEAQEWMLPWWWKSYSAHNSFPVTFIDFGLSAEAKAFCEERGRRCDLILPSAFAANDQIVPEHLVKQWKEAFHWEDEAHFWHKRRLCHQKPFAFLLTPYEHTLWLDVDCEVCTSLQLLFDRIAEKEAIYITPHDEITQQLYQEKKILMPGEIGYNSGVVGFYHGSRMISTWAEKTVTEYPVFISDEDLFSRLAFLQGWEVEALESEYNWLVAAHGFNPQAKIYHWLGTAGKFFLSLRIQNIL